MSEAAHAAAAVNVAVVVVVAVCRVTVLLVRSFAKQDQPVAAAGRPITPEVAAPPVPTLTVNAAVPLLLTMADEVPKPLEMVGAVPESVRLFPTMNVVAACTVPATRGPNDESSAALTCNCDPLCFS